jgi:hypothetical protein
MVVIAVLLSAFVRTQPYHHSKSGVGTDSTLSALLILTEGIEKWCVRAVHGALHYDVPPLNNDGRS